jgi:hypothetical protein
MSGPEDKMSTYHLDKLFAPRSVTVVGASPRKTAIAVVTLSLDMERSAMKPT